MENMSGNTIWKLGYEWRKKMGKRNEILRIYSESERFLSVF